MITAIIRTCNRPDLFARALESLHGQTYKDWHYIVGMDTPYEYIPKYAHGYFFKKEDKDRYPFFYDRYCQQIVEEVHHGSWFFFLDDDDFLTSPDALANIAPYLADPDRPVVCQFLRNGVPKPRNGNRIDAGKIGLPCLFLHSKWKELVKCDGYKSGDYRMIKAVTDQLGYVFAPVVVVETDRRSFGK
jgi:GT2 family glycosyltransferase